jgi:hypothetical protein
MAVPTVCETRWGEIVTLFKNKHDDLVVRHPDCTEELILIRTALHTIGQLIHIPPPLNGNGAVWKGLVTKAEAERTVLNKHLDGKALFTGILRLYAAIHLGRSKLNCRRNSASRRGVNAMPWTSKAATQATR